MQRNDLINHDPFSALDKEIRTLIQPFLSKAKEADKTVNFCGQQATDLDSAQWLIDNGISQLTCGVDALVPLRIQLSGVDLT